jgi:hypothetical protein
MSVIITEEKRFDIKCPKCKNSWHKKGFGVKLKDIYWISNGRKAKIGGVVVPCFDPIARKLTCKQCGTTFKIEYIKGERVEFT